MPYHTEQLEFMLHLANSRPEWLTPFFRFLNYFDTPYFYFIIIPLMWFGISYQWGLRIFYWTTLNHLINGWAKVSFNWPRPTHDMPELGLFQLSSGGFPSGGAQLSMFLGSLLIYYSPKKWVKIGGIIYILLISFSRLYLGVHYPIDVLGGWLIGFALFFLFIKTRKALESWLYKTPIEFPVTLSLLVGLFLLIFNNVHISYIAGSIVGTTLGTYFSLKYNLFLPDPKTFFESTTRSLLAVALLFVLASLWPEEKSFMKSFATSVTLTLAASPVIRRCLGAVK
jgi:membrane-associated phospholipid phosphatase